jgi:predicted permease
MITLCVSFLLRMIPFYLTILLGFIAGKVINVSRDSVARLILYIFSPIVIFNGIINTRLDYSIFSLPFVTLAISILLCLSFYWLSSFLWKDSIKNLVAFSAGTGNTGYFGLPLALLLFDNQGEGIYIMALLGVIIYENTLGFYMIARGNHTMAECLMKLLKLPALYALVAGLAANLLHFNIPDIFVDFMKQIKGAFAVLGMMIIGLGIAGVKQFKLDFRFIGMTFLAKFVVWPLLIALTIAIDTYLTGYFNQSIYQALTLLSFVPLAANMVIFASLLEVHPEKAATAVLLSAIVSIIYIPVMVGCFILQ